MMSRDRLRQVLVVLATLALLVVNGLSNALPFNGINTGEISDRFQVYFVPAGYVFAIWGLIYVALIGYAAYQVLARRAADPVLRRVGYVYVASCAANCAWLFCWHYGRLAASVAVMLVLLLSLIAVYLLAGVGRRPPTKMERWGLFVPFSIYLGWISVATIANVTDLLWSQGWGGWGLGPQAWAVIMLVVGAALAALVSYTRRDVAFALVIVWSFVGIAVKQAGTPVVTVTAALMALVVAVTLVLFRMRPRTAKS
jgi:translocator protein